MQYNLADLFESIVDTIPDRDALVIGDESRFTYKELDERANRLAHHLASVGVGAGDHVGMYLYNGNEYVEGMLAAFKIRAVPININFRYVEDELHYLFHDADLVCTLHQAEFAPRIAAIKDRCPKLKALVSVGEGDEDVLRQIGSVAYEDATAVASPKRDFGPRSPDDQFIIYTGGTTGMPKGVMWRQEDMFFAGLAAGNPGGPPPERPEQVAERAGERAMMTMLVAPPLIHGAAQLGIFIAFLQGNKVVLTRRFDPDAIWRAVESEKAQTLTVVGDAMARPLAETLNQGDYNPTSLAIFTSAGAIFSDAVKDQLRVKLPNLAMIDSFGSTETGFQGMGTAGASPDKGLRFQMSETTTVLNEDLKPVKPGSGEMGRVARCGHVPLGYYNDPEKTAATFVEADGQRWVLAGDMAQIEPDGTITVFGRGSVCINSGGEKIFPEEVEAALKAHPDVFDAVVVGVPDERWGQRVAAVVQARGGQRPSFENLDEHCRTKIAGYKVPREVHWVDQMVRSPAGKPDYPWAQKLASNPEVEPSRKA